MTHRPAGRVIFLNGASSSGKTTIAEQLLLVLETPYFHFGVDAFNGMRGRERTNGLPGSELDAVLRRTRAGFHRAVAGMAQAGNDLVVDYVLSEPWRLADCLSVFAGLEVIFVGVHCSPDELDRREALRGDRQPGQARAQLDTVHAHRLYDLECDTEAHSARDCALQIKAYLDRGHRPTAFVRLVSGTGR